MVVTTRSKADKAEIDAAFALAKSTLGTGTTRSSTSSSQEEEPTTTRPAPPTEHVHVVSSRSFLPHIPIMPGEAPPSALEEEAVFDPITNVHDFVCLIETVPADKWQQRTAALDSLVETLVHNNKTRDNNNNDENQQETLSTMVPALSRLLKDPRSTVVKRTCAALKKLFSPFKDAVTSSSSSDDASSAAATTTTCLSHVLEKLFPTILDVAALTSTVIRHQVQEMTVVLLQSKAATTMTLKDTANTGSSSIPVLLLERLNDPKVNKSKTVREACILYLTLVIQHCSYYFDGDETEAAEETTTTTELLSRRMGNQLIVSWRDSAPSVREQARKGLEVLRQKYAVHWATLVHDNPSSRDLKLKKVLIQSLEEPTVSLEKLLSKKRPSAVAAGNKKIRGFSKFRSLQQQLKKNNPQHEGGILTVIDENTNQNQGTGASRGGVLMTF